MRSARPGSPACRPAKPARNPSLSPCSVLRLRTPLLLTPLSKPSLQFVLDRTQVGRQSDQRVLCLAQRVVHLAIQNHSAQARVSNLFRHSYPHLAQPVLHLAQLVLHSGLQPWRRPSR